MQLTTETIHNVLLIALEGQINGNNSAELKKILTAYVEDGAHKIALDFSQVDYISSAGLRVVLLLAESVAGQAGQLVLYGLKASVFEVFEMAGFVDILTIVNTREMALARFQ
ncbi:MAG: STAS domain-containing protein [Zoogloeaceae bacterium]|nr:STAS domain-containing protein [Zoogloeaceae bacterium]